MIFYADVAKDLVDDSYKLLTTMVVYKEKQPSVAEYVAKVNDGTYKWTGLYLLQAYTGVALSSNKFESLYRIEKTGEGTSYVGQNIGAAEWAVLFDESMLNGTNKLLEVDSITNSINFVRNITEDDLFMIVPVSDTTGVGVLRFDTINFDGSEKSIRKFTLNFS